MFANKAAFPPRVQENKILAQLLMRFDENKIYANKTGFCLSSLTTHVVLID